MGNTILGIFWFLRNFNFFSKKSPDYELECLINWFNTIWWRKYPQSLQISKKQGNCALILMDQICPISCDNWETECHTDSIPFQSSFGMTKNVKIPIENFSCFQWFATNRTIFSEWLCKIQKNKKVHPKYNLRIMLFWQLAAHVL